MKKARLVASSLCLICALTFTMAPTAYAIDDQGGSNSTKTPPPPPPSGGLLGNLIATLIKLVY